MTHKNILTRDNTLLLVVDMQEPFLRSVYNRDNIIANVRILVQVAKNLSLPLVVTLQYMVQMGDVTPVIAEALPEGERINKLTFSCWGAQRFRDRLTELGRSRVLVCGVETHICVNQTVHDLLNEGYDVHLASDAISSRTEENYRIGLAKMQQSGAVISSTETAIFELLQEAGTPEFKAVLKLVK